MRNTTPTRRHTNLTPTYRAGLQQLIVFQSESSALIQSSLNKTVPQVRLRVGSRFWRTKALTFCRCSDASCSVASVRRCWVPRHMLRWISTSLDLLACSTRRHGPSRFQLQRKSMPHVRRAKRNVRLTSCCESPSTRADTVSCTPIIRNRTAIRG